MNRFGRGRSGRRQLLVAALAAGTTVVLGVTAVALGPSSFATETPRGAAAVPSPAGAALAASWTPPLSTEGRYVVDATGRRFKLMSGNWHGASGTWDGSGDPADPAHNHAGEVSYELPLGLARAPIAAILASFHELGVNSIRLPFSDQLLRDTAPVPDAAVTANPQLRGKTPLQVYDAVVAALTADGFAVILNNHTTTAKWCCGVDGNERWNSGQTVDQWVADWLTMARRYAGNPRVVGADLRNEVRRDVFDDPNWGGGDSHDWWAAAQQAGDRILSEANPNLLIVVEGINWTGLPVDGLPHGRPDLTPARTLSHTLVRSHKLVYSVHFYGYTGPNHSGATGIGETHDPRYQDLSPQQLNDAMYQEGFFVSHEPGSHFTAPVWVSEFGVGGRDVTDPATKAWFAHTVDDLIAMDADFAYWPLVGYDLNGQGNGWALMNWDPAGKRMGLFDGDDWRAADWNRLVHASSFTGPAPHADDWNMLTVAHADYDQSLRMRAAGDWDAGARKAACPDGERLIGLAHTGGNGLCTDAGAPGPLWPSGGGYTLVRDESHVGQDWARGYTKLQCPDGDLMTGYSVRGADLSGALCVPAARALGGGGRTVWFDRGDSRATGHGADWAAGAYKGQCADDEYLAGVAYTSTIWSPAKSPDAILCRALS